MLALIEAQRTGLTEEAEDQAQNLARKGRQSI